MIILIGNNGNYIVRFFCICMYGCIFKFCNISLFCGKLREYNNRDRCINKRVRFGRKSIYFDVILFIVIYYIVWFCL